MSEPVLHHFQLDNARMDNARRFRGILGVAATWGIALSALATGTLALGLATGLVPSSIFGARELIALSVRGLLFGGVAGGLFAWMLANRYRGQILSNLSTTRVAWMGFVGAACIPTILALATTGPVLPLGVLIGGTVGFGLIGSALGTATLKIARRDLPRLEGAHEDSNRLLP